MATRSNNIDSLLEKIKDLEGSVAIWKVLSEHIWLLRNNQVALEKCFNCLELKLGESAAMVALLLARECL